MTKKKLKEQYRRALHKICGLPTKGLLPSGVKVCVEDVPGETETHGDIVHPCVRFIEEGFEGHQWWMVYTPFYGGNSDLENPVLCYADAASGKAPARWTYYCTIKERPVSGYNSDPTMFFNDGRLYVYWRENYTSLTESHGCSRATIGCCVHDRRIDYFTTPQLIEIPRNKDREVSPTFLPHGDGFRAYAVHMRFCSKLMYFLPRRIEKLVYRAFNITNMLGIYCRFKSFGVAIWDGVSPDGAFRYSKTLKFRNVNWLCHPWHMDLFEADEADGKKQLYAIVMTNPSNADISLARMEGEIFRFYKKPATMTIRN